MDGAATESTDLPHFDVSEFVRRVLAEDLGKGGDVTSKATIDAHARFTAEMNCREPIVVAGLDIAIAFFRAMDREVRIERLAEDGDALAAVRCCSGSTAMRGRCWRRSDRHSTRASICRELRP